MDEINIEFKSNKMKKYSQVISFFVFSLFWGGCSTNDFFSDEDILKMPQFETSMDEKTELVTLKNGLQLVKKGDTYYLDDMILTKVQVDILDQPVTKGTYYDLDWYALWPNQKVYYKISPSFTHPQLISEAISAIQARTNIVFIERTTEPNYIWFVNSTGNSSNVGCVGGLQYINIATMRTGTVIHEICHALGMSHEQARLDRDNYININWGNIRPEMRHNFNTVPGTKQTAFFDFNSIMLYPSFITDMNFVYDATVPCMTKKDGSTFTTQRDALSVGDIESLNAMYPRTEYPYITGIDMFKYQQGSGEYTLWMKESGYTPIVETNWTCSGNAILHDIPYPDDATFIENPILFKAIDFYQTGNYNIIVRAKNSKGYNSYSKSFYIQDVKSNFPMSISPNPMKLGTSVDIEFILESSQILDEDVAITVYNGEEKVYQTNSNKKKMKIDLSKLQKGKYNVVAKRQKMSYTTTIEIN